MLLTLFALPTMKVRLKKLDCGAVPATDTYKRYYICCLGQTTNSTVTATEGKRTQNMSHTRRDFIQNSIALAGAAALTLKANAANAAETETAMAAEETTAQATALGGKAVDKAQDLASVTTLDKGPLTTNVGQPISTDQNSLRAGQRGPTLLEDYVLREKLQHFDHERIPERIVHARGAAAHGYFQVYQPLADLTTANVLNDPALKTPVFVRFSTVAGSRGSADTARDVRGFAVKMYTPEGNWDIVGNNIPVFFIQDAIKFPDLIHAVKPEPQQRDTAGSVRARHVL